MNGHKTPDTHSSERLIAFSRCSDGGGDHATCSRSKLPEGLSDTDLFVAIPALAHNLWCYVLSFVVIGVLWMAHYNQFAHIRRVDGALMWLNLFFLMAVALIPFVTSVMSGHSNALPTMLYAAVLMMSCLMSAAMWGYACRKPE